jgi:hypothetical protein
MTLEERVDLVLAVARVLFVNGQSTEQTLAAAERLGDALGLHVTIIPRWGELQFQSLANDARLISAVSADPTNVAMGRVASAMRVVAIHCLPCRSWLYKSRRASMPNWVISETHEFGAENLGVTTLGDENVGWLDVTVNAS